MPTDMCALQDFDEPDKLQIQVDDIITIIEGRWVIKGLKIVIKLTHQAILGSDKFNQPFSHVQASVQLDKRYNGIFKGNLISWGMCCYV